MTSDMRLTWLNPAAAGATVGKILYGWDENGNLTSTSTTGSVIASSGIQGSLGYQSGWTDTSTGRVNMRSRWYNPDTGRFDTRDSVTLSPAPASINANRYAYANGNPLGSIDPDGHAAMATGSETVAWACACASGVAGRS